MVSTRSSIHPDEIVSEPTMTPRAVSNSKTRRTVATKSKGWEHAPSRFTLLWMAISLPLVTWDTIYVLGRPHTMEGGWMHWPLWVPYQLYGEVDHVYGWVAFNAKSGFTSAQGFLNVVETLMYLFYVYQVYNQGAWKAGGRKGANAALIGFSAAVMTLSKTVLYWANEYFGNFAGIGHNSWGDLILLWIIPNGAWLLGSTEMIYSIGGDIAEGLAGSSSRNKKD